MLIFWKSAYADSVSYVILSFIVSQEKFISGSNSEPFFLGADYLPHPFGSPYVSLQRVVLHLITMFERIRSSDYLALSSPRFQA